MIGQKICSFAPKMFPKTGKCSTIANEIFLKKLTMQNTGIMKNSLLYRNFAGFPEETIHSLFELRRTIEVKTKPVEPSDDDCCGTGCVPCVFDTYEEKLKKYNQWLDKQKTVN